MNSASVCSNAAILDRLTNYEVDLVVSYDGTASAPEDRVKVFDEAVTPVCSPDFAATHAHVLARPVAWDASVARCCS